MPLKCFKCHLTSSNRSVGKCANCEILVCNKCAPNRLCNTVSCNKKNRCNGCNKISLNIIHCLNCNELTCPNCYKVNAFMCNSSLCRKISKCQSCKKNNASDKCTKCKEFKCKSCINKCQCEFTLWNKIIFLHFIFIR